jgi:ADP-ribose pyrophosphatase
VDEQSFADAGRVVFKGALFEVHRAELCDIHGAKHPFDAVIHPGAAVVLPLVGDNIVMIRNRRFAIGQELWELPAGILEPHEEAEKTALRELQEETGYAAVHIKKLISFYTSPGMSTELIHGFVAWGLTLEEQNLEPTEQIKVEILTKSEVLNLLQHGHIKDAKTALLLLHYMQFGYGSRRMAGGNL